jgi:hypothetical protein
MIVADELQIRGVLSATISLKNICRNTCTANKTGLMLLHTNMNGVSQNEQSRFSILLGSYIINDRYIGRVCVVISSFRIRSKANEFSSNN